MYIKDCIVVHSDGHVIKKKPWREITAEQYHMLMQGFEVIARHPIVEIEKAPQAM